MEKLAELMKELDLTPEQVSFITIEALNQMVTDGKKKGEDFTVEEIFEAIVAKPNSEVAKYFKVYLQLGVKVLNQLKEEHRK